MEAKAHTITAGDYNFEFMAYAPIQPTLYINENVTIAWNNTPKYLTNRPEHEVQVMIVKLNSNGTNSTGLDGTPVLGHYAAQLTGMSPCFSPLPSASHC